MKPLLSTFNASLKSLFIVLTAALSIVGIFLPIQGCSGDRKEPGWQNEEGAVWNTSYHITYQSKNNLRDSIISVLDRVGKSLSVFDPSSLVCRVNSQDSTIVNGDFQKVYFTSVRLFKLSNGSFDPTLSPLITAWGFGPGHTPTSDTLRIDSLKKFIGIDKTRLEGNMLYKEDPRIQFNFSAIAKGYGCDAIGEMFKRNGVNNFLIEIGGEIKANGNNPENGKWRISIDRPILSADKALHESQEIIEITDMGVATSGNYRNFHSDGNRIYGHTISPVTGRPVQTDIISATVVTPSAMNADGLATTFMSLGSEEVIRLNEKISIPIMLVLQDSSVWTSPQFDLLIAQ